MDRTPIDITGLDRNEVLAALCNNTLPMGRGALNDRAMESITADDCKELFVEDFSRNGVFCFDYVFGRPIKVNFVTEGDKVFLDRVRYYDRDAGQGKCQRIVDELRGQQ